MRSSAATVEDYLKSLPPDRAQALRTIRRVVLDNLDRKHCTEGMQYGMIGYCIPHGVYPPGYHCNPEEPLPVAGLASQKNHMALYLSAIYADPATAEWFRKSWTAAGRKLDMGKGCVRFKKIEDVPLDVVGELFARFDYKTFIATYEATVAGASRAAAKRTPAPKAPGGAKAARRPAGKSPPGRGKPAARRPKP